MRTSRTRLSTEGLPGIGSAVVLAGMLWCAAALAAGAQEKLASAYIKAAATGDPAALLGLYHPGELEDLRARVLKTLETEAQQGDSAARTRLFGAAASIDDVRRLTPSNLYLAVARSVGMPAERVEEVKILGIVEENSQLVHAVARVVPPGDAKLRPRVAIVSMIRYGKDWRAQLPGWLQARVDGALAAPAEERAGAEPGAPRAVNPPDLLGALRAGSETLRRGDCVEFFNEHMSPAFRRSTSAKAFDTLIKQCETREETRETYISALEIAQRLAPKFEQDGARAVYDMSGQGLPFRRFVLEKIEERWYVAE